MSMFWQEDSNEEERFTVPDDVVDLCFHIRCKQLPIDHAQALSDALARALDWLHDEPAAGVHLIHVAESGNGWFRPDDAQNQLLHLSRRTRLSLRVPRHRVDDALALNGSELDIAGHRLSVGEGTVKHLSVLPTLFARYVLLPDGMEADSEEDFMVWAAAELKAMEIPVRKALCGRAASMKLAEGEARARSLMVADLEPRAAVRLQERGLGGGRKVGCGLFVPHKGIRAVHEMQADKKSS